MLGSPDFSFRVSEYQIVYVIRSHPCAYIYQREKRVVIRSTKSRRYCQVVMTALVNFLQQRFLQQTHVASKTAEQAHRQLCPVNEAGVEFYTYTKNKDILVNKRAALLRPISNKYLE